MLVEITKILKQLVTAPDVTARLGGGEFGLLFQRPSQNEFNSLTDKIIKKLDEHLFVWGEHKFSVNASIGLVAITAEKMSRKNFLPVLT